MTLPVACAGPHRRYAEHLSLIPRAAIECRLAAHQRLLRPVAVSGQIAQQRQLGASRGLWPGEQCSPRHITSIVTVKDNCFMFYHRWLREHDSLVPSHGSPHFMAKR
jgi:hypothetical protein